MGSGDRAYERREVMDSFEDAVVVVTGGASGIGAEISRRFADEGARVCVVDVNGDRAGALGDDLEKRSGRAAHAVIGDLADGGLPDRVVTEVTSRWEALDVVVNNAGVFLLHPFREFPDDAWQRTLEVNLTAPMRLSRAAARYMGDHGGGAIVNVTSLGAELGGAGAAAYSASKGGLKALTHVLAVELAPLRIRVNAVSPHAIATEMTATMQEDDALAAQVLAGIPWGRLGQPKDVAAAVLFLARGDADFVTGATVAVQGGAGVQIF